MNKKLLSLMLLASMVAISACSRVPGPRDPKIQVWKHVPEKKGKDPMVARQWSLKMVKADKAWKLHEGSSQISVAIIGTGIDYNHPDLKRNIWLNPGESDRKKRRNKRDDDGNGYADDIIGWDFVDNDNKPYDRHGVDTHAAGIISAVRGNGIGVAGIAPRTSLMVLRYINDRGYGSIFDAVDSLNYAIDHGARVIYFNWSYGFARRYHRLLSRVFSRAGKKGILIVTGAGNQSANLDVKKIYPSSFKHDNLIVVGASTKKDGLAGMSNFGRQNVDIVAPGVDILSTVPGGKYGKFSGTTTAAAHVSGAVALCLSFRASNMPVHKVKEFIVGSKRVDYIESLDPYILSGGRLNVLKALTN